MFVTYVPSSNTATNGVALGSDTQSDVLVKKIIIGAPVNSGNIFLYNETNPVNASTANIALKLTMGGSVSESTQRVYDFTSNNSKGLPLSQGGNIIIDQTMQVTVLWDLAESVV